MVETTTIFDPAFMHSLEGLRVIAKRTPAGGRMAEQRSRAKGAGVEFSDVRPYVPGDDFRAIDWHLYQRLDKIFLKLFQQDEDLPIYFLLDQSASMATAALGSTKPEQTRSRSAKQTVAALSYVAINHLDRIAVYPFADRPLAPLPGASGRSAFHRLLAWLSQQADTGETQLASAIETFSHRRLRRGLCVVVSDFLDPAGADAIVNSLKMLRHSIVLVRIAHPDEERPKLHGELDLIDSETGRSLAVHVDDTLLDRYAKAYAEFSQKLDDLASARQGQLITIKTDQPTVPQVAQLFEHGVHKV